MHARFDVQEQIATGGYSRVFRTYDRQRQCQVALKRPLPGKEAALQHEVQVLQRLNHAHIVVLLESGRDAEGDFACLEWLQGQSLESRLQYQSLTEIATKALLRQLLSALAAVHAAGFAHADVKAENIFIADKAQAKLIDFGIAAPLQHKVEGLVGSTHFMAPELFDGQPPSVASDLYAVGVLAYQCLSGQLPFQGETKPQVITAHLRHWRTPLRELCPVSPALESWIETLMAPKPGLRPPSATVALEKLPAD